MDEDGISKSPKPRSKSRGNLNSAKSLYRMPKQKYDLVGKSESPSSYHNDFVYPTTTKESAQLGLNSVEDQKEKNKHLTLKDSVYEKGKIFTNPSLVMKDCWKMEEKPVKLVELFKENHQEEENEDEEVLEHYPFKKIKLHLETENEKLSPTPEFHVLTEIQKAKILNAVEDTIKNLAKSDLNENWLDGKRPYEENTRENTRENSRFNSVVANVDRYFCKKFLLPWVFMKVVEMILCHLIQITFLSNNTFYERKYDFIPIIVTYYLTLLIVVISLILHVSCYSYIGIQNPCYFMGVISSSVITLTTSSGTFVLLCSMEYYKSFREILVLVFISGLLCTLFAELCLFYVEVKNFWSMIETTDQYYIP